MGDRIRKYYSLRILIPLINILVLTLPLIGIASLRIFENVLHRQTESKLIAEASYLQALYTASLKHVTRNSKKELEPPLVKIIKHDTYQAYGDWRLFPPTIDLWKDDVLPPGDPAITPKGLPSTAAQMAANNISHIIKDAQRYNLSGTAILDVNGTVLYSTSDGDEGRNFGNRHEVQEALQGRYCSVLRSRPIKGQTPSSMSLSRRSRIRIYVAVPILEGEKLSGVVYVHRTSLTLFRDLWESRFGIAALLLVTATIFISLLLSFIITRPIKSMIRQAEKIAGGESNVSLAAGAAATVEATQLSIALSTMVEKLKQRMDYINEFARNVSHEFKTPLTSIQGAIEILDENWPELSDHERERFISIIDTESHRMDLLVKRLLELARIENAEADNQTSNLIELIDHIEHRYTEAGKSFELEKDTEQAEAIIAPEMAETLITNLIDNAFSHGQGEGVMVRIASGPVVSVTDHGPGISTANLPRVFDRFFTTARDKGGTGLGLSMVKAIADSCGANLVVTSREDGTTFSVKFKKPKS